MSTSPERPDDSQFPTHRDGEDPPPEPTGEATLERTEALFPESHVEDVDLPKTTESTQEQTARDEPPPEDLTRPTLPAGSDPGAFVPPSPSPPPSPGALSPVNYVSPHSGAGSWGTIEATGRLQPGQVVFGRYMVLGLLGRGGMGTVWRVRHTELDVERALKLIVAGIAQDPQARARFRREAQLMARFSHPHAVTVNDARLSENDVAFIEMELVRGQSLDKLIQKGKPMPLDWTARVLAQLCEVLQVANDLQVVHRDLKPSNLMLLDGRPAGQEHLKVLDFGIAKMLDAQTREGDPHTLTNAFIGTPPYASPEQADGDTDPRSDLYSVGVMLYEFLTGYRPFTGPTGRLISDTLHTPPPPFATINPKVQVPPEVERVVMRCLAKKPEDRPQSPRELAEEFRRALPTTAEAPPPPDRRALSRPVVAAIALGPTLVVGLALAYNWSRPNKPPSGGNGGSSTRTNGQSKPIEPRSLPQGYEVADATEVGAWPAAIRNTANGAKFVRVEGTPQFWPGGVADIAGTPLPPAWAIRIPDLYVQDTEVTNDQMLAYLQKTEARVPDGWKRAVERLGTSASGESGRHPAVGIPHDMAEDFASKMGGRLLSSAEWEFLARSRGRLDRPYVWAGDSAPKMDDPRANIDSRDKPGPPTLPVGSFNTDKTEQGIFDLTGNVREWCRDKDVSRLGGGEQVRYAVRGGSWYSDSTLFSTTACPTPEPGNQSAEDLGFRVAIEWPPRP
jgi:serine/threonine protein kinase